MKTLTSAAPCAGAQETCVQTVSAAFQPVARWTLFGAIEACRFEIGLNGGDLVALRALLSFLPLKDGSGIEVAATHDMLLTCYASNASVCTRANGMDESTLRRHIRRLVSAGLIQRNDSATGKRFPLKKGGVIQKAYGIDLRPAFLRSQELIDLAADLEDRAEARRMLRSETMALRQKLLSSRSEIDNAARRYLEGLTNFLRRKSTTTEQIAEARDSLRTMLDDTATTVEKGHPALPADNQCIEPTDYSPQPSQDEPLPERRAARLPAGDVQNTRQVESQTLKNKTIYTSYDTVDDPGSYPDLLRRYPNAAAFLPQSLSNREQFFVSLRSLGLSLGLGPLPIGELIEALGLSSLLAAFDRMIQRIEGIAHPRSYFEKMVAAEMPLGAL